MAIKCKDNLTFPVVTLDLTFSWCLNLNQQILLFLNLISDIFFIPYLHFLCKVYMLRACLGLRFICDPFTCAVWTRQLFRNRFCDGNRKNLLFLLPFISHWVMLQCLLMKEKGTLHLIEYFQRCVSVLFFFSPLQSKHVLSTNPVKPDPCSKAHISATPYGCSYLNL